MVRPLYCNPSLHLDTIAVTEFMASYVPQSPYDYLPDVYLDQRTEVSLVAPVRAVSLAMTACKLKDPRILVSARQLYATALSDTNTTLRNPHTATRNSTLLSVLLLGLFEAFASQVSGISSDWAKHTAGALTLLRLRGKTQFNHKLGRRLFDHVCSVLNFDTMIRRAPMSQDLTDLISTAKILGYDSPKLAMVMLTGEITASPCVLWDDAMQHSARVAKALQLDQRVLQFIEDLPPDFAYQELGTEHFDASQSDWDIYGYTVHQYRHHHAARMWNACRVLRIKLNSVIHTTLNQGSMSAWSTPKDRKDALQLATQNIEEAASDICASVPQFLSPAKYDTVNHEASREACIATLLPALSVTKAEPLVPKVVRIYVADRLKYLGREFKVSQAERAATSGLGLDVLHSGFHMLYVY